MICLRTTDDWTTATITLDDGGGPQVFTPTSAVKDARAAAVEFAAFLTATYGVATTIEYLRIAATGATIRISNPDPYTITYSTAGLAIYGGVDGVDAQFVWTGPSGAVAGLVAPGSEESRIYLSQPVKTTPGVRPAASVGAICAQPPGTSLNRVRAMSSAGDIDVAQLRNALEVAANPRTAVVYDANSGNWFAVAVGDVAVSQGTALRRRVDWQIVGGS